MRIAALLLCANAVGLSLVGAAPPASQVRAAAERAIQRLQASQKNWYENTTCSSCHHQFLPALAFREARRHGIAVDEKVAAADAKQAFAIYSNLDPANLDRAIEHAHAVDPGLGDAYGLVAADAAGVRSNVVTAVYARFLAQRQKPDGHWNEFDERPPQSYSLVTATALTIRAISLYADKRLRDDTRQRLARARQWLTAIKPRDTEERAFQLFGLTWSGGGCSDCAKQLEALQQSDGGWNSLDERASDAYSTGEALAALEESGITGPVIDQGIAYLLKTQKPDGTWRVASRLHPPAPLSPDYFESGYPYGHDQMISALGANWAIIALADSLPHAQEAASKLYDPASVAAPWAETVLFGSADDVRALLDKGLDPNAATPAGTTALMMAAPDVDKVKLLLDRGANVNARTKDGYTALLMASMYTNGTPALKLLLDRGAKLDSPDALFHAYPAALATIAGNAEGVTLLHRAGDDVNQLYTYAGLQPGPPLILISTFGDVPVARALIDAGAKVDTPDGDGMTALTWATLANQTGMVKLLIEDGAQVNHMDKHGMTPLLYAASIDFGDDSMIQLLLQHGADRKARTKEGLPALDLARKYRHTHLLKALEH